MKPFDKPDDYSDKSVPEMIKLLWTLYMDMSSDPALATSACHVRSAALELERLRRMAMQVSQEKARQPGKRNSRKSKRLASDEALEWLRTVRTASPSKH